MLPDLLIRDYTSSTMTKPERYIPPNHPLVFDKRRAREDSLKRYQEQSGARDKLAREKLIAKLGSMAEAGVPTQTIEVVYPLSLVAAGLFGMFGRQKGTIIRADTIHEYGLSYAFSQSMAQVRPTLGYVLPRIESKSNQNRLQEAILQDGSVGRVMTYGRYGKPNAIKFYALSSGDRTPPTYAYRCDDSYRVHFLPRSADHHFAERGCLPVWGESLTPLSYQNSYSIEQLLLRMDDIIAQDMLRREGLEDNPSLG